MDTPARKEPGYQPPPNRAQILERERVAWKMRCRGATYQTIGEALGMTAAGAYKLLRRVESRWAARNARSVDRIKAAQNAQLESIIESGFKIHDKSLEPRSRVTERVGVDGETVRSTEVLEGMGDIRPLDLVLRAHAAQRSLQGMDINPAENPGMFTVSGLTASLDAEAKVYEAELRREFTYEQRMEHLAQQAKAEFEAQKRKLGEAYGKGNPPCDAGSGSAPGV